MKTLRKEPQVGQKLRAYILPRLRSIDEKARTIEFVASTEAVDRYGDVIRVAGWKYQNYLKNPVFLWAHRSGDPPIGKCVDLKVETNPPALVQRIQFADAATYPFAETVFRLYKDGFMRAVSVGFMANEHPTPMKDDDGNMTGWEFTDQELLELSAVPIPANPEAVARAVSSGVTEEDVKKFFSFGEKNPAWSYLAPGVTYAVPENDAKEKNQNDMNKDDKKKVTGRQDGPAEPPEDEPDGSIADNAEELGEQLDECAAGVAEAQQLLAVIISQLETAVGEENDAARPATVKARREAASDTEISGVLAKMVETRSRLDAIAGTVARQPELADATARINELRVLVDKQVSLLSALSETAATKAEIADVIARFDEVRTRLDKLTAHVAKESALGDVITRIDEVRTRLDKVAGAAVKKSDLADVAAKVDAARVILDNTTGSVATKVELADVNIRVDDVRARVESLANVAARESSVATAAAGVDEVRARFDNLFETAAKESTVTDVVAGLNEVRTRLDAVAANVATKADAAEQVAKFEAALSAKFESLANGIAELLGIIKAQKLAAEEKTVCPYTDDPIAPKGTPWDASAEMAKQSTPEGWKHMSTVIVGDSKLKGSYKLPHHSGSGFKVIPNGVRAALGRFEQTQMDSADRAGARSHLLKHQKKISAQSGIDFDDAAFETKLAQLGDAYRAAEAAGLTAFSQSVSREIDALMATLDGPAKPDTISTPEDLFAKLVKR